MSVKIIFIACILILVLTDRAESQDVKISCTEVLTNGDILISWDPLDIGASFSDYTIYYSNLLNGPYAVLDVITIMAQDSYIHTGANADNDTNYYYLLTDQGIAGTTITDTIATILLDGFTGDDEIIDFNWSPPHYPSPFLPEMYPKYFLYREYPPGNWAIIDSTENLSLSNHFWECNGNNDTVRFKIGVRNDENDCISFSNQVNKMLKNLRKPGQPVIDSVSIGGTDLNCLIGWQAGADLDIVGYIIYRVSGTIDSIGYANGKETSFYIDSTSTPCNGPVKYVLSAIDSCGNKSPLTFRPHNSLYLQDITYDPCLMSNTLTWNNYRNFDPPLQGYMIYVSENGGPYQILVTVDTNTTLYDHENLQQNTAYSYFIRAFNQGNLKTSTSCVQSVTTYNSPKPQFMYTRFVTVEDNERVSLLFYTDTVAHVQYYRILRSTQQSGPYEEVSVIQNQGQEFISYTDEGALVNEESYFYQVEVIDSCGIASVIANTARTILLQVEALPDLINRLSWNAYESWSGGIAGYRVYRRLDDGSPGLIADLGPNTLDYDDNVSSLTGSVSKISYITEAYEGASNIYGFREQSYSNEVTSEQEPKVFMPNAFAPNGINNILVPQTVFVGSEGYEFQVYNRWGQLIFSTSNPGEGWDGKLNGNYVSQDIYVYIVFYRDALDQPRQTMGNVLVLF